MAPPPSEPLDPACALLAEHAWVQRLARRLVADPARAEDLAQETWLQALQRPPERGGPLRAWLGGVLRNLARQERRSRIRRTAREEAVARPEAIDAPGSGAAALGRLERQQAVVQAVLALEEPYRSTVVRRFYEGLPPRAIARADGVPVATVKTRLARGLARLRARLDGAYGGDGRSWVLFLLPLTRPRVRVVPWISGAMAVNTLTKTGIVAAGLVGLVVWWARREGEPRADLQTPVAVAADVGLEEPPPWDPPSRVPPAARTELEVEPAQSPVAEDAALVEEPRLVEGIVVDPAGTPIAGVAVGLRGANGSAFGDREIPGYALWTQSLDTAGDPPGTSAADGSFAFEAPEEVFGRVVCVDELWETVLAPWAFQGEPLTLVVAPRIRVAGTVRDVAGLPLADVHLDLGIPADRVRLPAGLGQSESLFPGWSTTTDAEGRFELARLPAVGGALLRARLVPYEDWHSQRDTWTDDELEIVLVEPEGGWLEGRVESGGRPLAGATVSLGYRPATTDEKGRFRIPLGGLEAAEELVAFAPGHRPTRLRGDREADGPVRWPGFVLLALEPGTLTLAGSVLDADGAPLAHQEVWLADPTYAYVTPEGFAMTLEPLLAGRQGQRHGTETDAQGRFELEGLEDRAYTLKVVDKETALLFEQGPFRPGDGDVTLREPAEALWPVLRGRVVSVRGEGIAGASLAIDREADLVGIHGASTFFLYRADGARTTTDDTGHFELLRVPREGVTLHVWGEGLADPELELTPILDPEELEVIVHRHVRLQVEVTGAHEDANAFAVLDADGQALQMDSHAGGKSELSWQFPLPDGLSPVVGLSDAGITLVLYHDGEELARVPLLLEPGILNRVDV